MHHVQGVDVVRLVKRYGGGSRKLYDTEESRYVGLEDLAAWIQAGQAVQVVDAASGDDVTAPVLAQVIYETHRTGAARLPTAFLHDVIRRGGKALGRTAQELQSEAARLVRASVTRFTPVRAARRELGVLRRSLAALEQSVANLERAGLTPAPAAGRRARRGGRRNP